MRLSGSALIALSLLSILGLATAAERLLTRNRVHAQSGCSIQSLNGAYGYSHTGFFYTSQGLNTFGAAGIITADGNGNLTGTDTTTQNGQITRNRTYTGTYQVNASCMGLVTFQSGSQTIGNMDFVVVNGGKTVKFIQSDTGTVITGTAELVSPSQQAN